MLSDDEFARLVAEDVKNKSSVEQRNYLKSPGVRDRWRRALYLLIDNLNSQVEQIDNIEWTPGAGNPPTLSPEYIPQYKKIQASGKRLLLLAKPTEIEPLLSELSPRGLFIHTNVDSEDEANDLLRKVEKWSARRGFFSV